MPHVPPAAAPVSTSVRLELEAAKHAFPQVVITDPRREHGWRVALAKSKVEGPDPDPSALSHEPEFAQRRTDDDATGCLLGDRPYINGGITNEAKDFAQSKRD